MKSAKECPEQNIEEVYWDDKLVAFEVLDIERLEKERWPARRVRVEMPTRAFCQVLSQPYREEMKPIHHVDYGWEVGDPKTSYQGAMFPSGDCIDFHFGGTKVVAARRSLDRAAAEICDADRGELK